MNTSERLRHICKARKIPFARMEKALGWSNGCIARTKTDLTADKIVAASRYLHVPIEYLLYGDIPDERDELGIPLYEYVSAGNGSLMNPVSVGYLDLKPPKDGYEYFAVKVKGDSMSPRIADGDTVIARKQSDVKSGEIAVVTVNGDEATCKKIVKSDSGIAFVGLNTDVYVPTFYTRKEIEDLPITILGKVIKVVAEI